MSFAEKKVAKCYILHDLDEGNTCELSDRKLTVVKNGKKHEFAIERITSVSREHRKLLIPIIFSGIITPLVFVGFFKGLFHPIIALVFIIGGIFSFYLGWLGELTLTIHLTSGHRDFPVPILTDNLKAFMEFVNQYLGNEPIHKRALYLETKEIGSDDQKFYDSLNQEQDYNRLYTYWNMKDKYDAGEISSKATFIVLDPINTGAVIQYRKSETNEGLVPFIKGPISKKAVLEIIRGDHMAAIFQ